MLNNNFILLIIVVVGVVLGNFYYSSLTSEIFIAPPLSGRVDDLSGLASLSLDVSSLKQSKINALKIFGEYPVNPGTTGKRNLFAPI